MGSGRELNRRPTGYETGLNMIPDDSFLLTTIDKLTVVYDIVAHIVMRKLLNVNLSTNP